MMKQPGEETPHDDESTAGLAGQMASVLARNAQLETLVQQTSERLGTLVKSMTGSVAALQSMATPSQHNHLFVLETQITYLQRLADDLAAAAEQPAANDIR